MKSTATVKDIKKRALFFKLEENKKIKKFLFINLLNRFYKKSNKIKSKTFKSDNILKSLIFIKFARASRIFSKVKLKNRCIFTGRNRSVNKKYSISRIKFRELLQFGIIPGYKKAVW